MKNMKTLIVIAAVLLVTISGGTYYSLANDSGFDTSYSGGGSSSDSGSSYSGGYSYDGGSSSSSSGGDFTELDGIIIFSVFSFIVFGIYFLAFWSDLIKFDKKAVLVLIKILAVWVPILILCLIFTFETIVSLIFTFAMIGLIILGIVSSIKDSKKGKKMNVRKDTRESLEHTYKKLVKLSNNKVDLSNYIKDFDKNKFLNDRYNDYLDIQNAWMNFDYDKLRSKLTDELYNQYELQLNTLKMKNQQNIMRDFTFINSEIVGTKIDKDLLTVRILLETSFYDYITKNNRVFRGTSKKKVVMLYSITYVSRIENNVNTCPHCGAEINNSASQVCEYCKGTISSISSDWVMSKKEAIKQIME